MVTITLFICMFILTGLYAVMGSIMSSRLSKHIGYEEGFLKLWNITQKSVMSSCQLDYSLEDTESQKLFSDLKRIIILFYTVSIPLGIITFVVHFLGY